MTDRPTEPTEAQARAAYRAELDVCFIVRMPRAMRDAIEDHGRWMAARYKLERVSLAAASRDLFHRGLYLSPQERRHRKKLDQARQLELFEPRPLEHNLRARRRAANA